MGAQAQQQRFAVHGAYTHLEALIGLARAGRELYPGGRHNAAGVRSGERRSRYRGRGLDMEELRIYQPGDDIRSIDWRVTARTQTPHTRLYREERERPVLLAGDLRSPMFFGSQCCFKSVQAASLLACLAWAVYARKDRLGGLLLGDQLQRDIRPRSNRHTLMAWLQALDACSHQLRTPAPESPPQPLTTLFNQLLRVSRPGSALYIVSDFHDFDAACGEYLHQLSRHADITLIQIGDPLEEDAAGQALAPHTPLWVSDGQQRRRVRAAEITPRLISRRRDRLQRLAGPLSIPVYTLLTSDPLVPTLRRWFAPRRRPQG